MSEFRPITTQEELDNVIKDRLNRQNEKHAREMAELSAKYEDYDAIKQQNGEYVQKMDGLNKQIEEVNALADGYVTQIAEKDEKIAQYETAMIKGRIAATFGLDPELANRLAGNTEEELTADAEKLSRIVGKSQRVAPLANSTNANGDDGVAAAFRKLNPNINI
jgi:DNA repair ATPase RecN